MEIRWKGGFMNNRDEVAGLGEYIQARRQARELSLEDAAQASGLDRSYWSRLERGMYETPSPRHLQKVARALDVPIEDLYGLAGYGVPERLPSFTPYLRAKYDLPPEAIRDLEKYFELLRNHFGIPKDQPVFPPKNQPEDGGDADPTEEAA
jgi:transcriptional regulator with XRE-family HTH domain